MKNAVIKLTGLIALVFCACQSADGISIGASCNGVSTQFDIQADESSSINGGLLLGSTGLDTVFSGSNIKKFNHTYVYPDSEGNKAILSVDLKNAKNVQLSISPVTGLAEASETLSVDDADLIKTGSKAITREGDSAKAELKIINGSLKGYENYANANLINELGDKTFIARQRADIASGQLIESTSQAISAQGDPSLPPASQAFSEIAAKDGQISDLFSEAAKRTLFSSWDNADYTISMDYHEIYANQFAGSISGIAGTGKKNASPVASIFKSAAEASHSEENTAGQEISMHQGIINDYGNEALVGSSATSISYSNGPSNILEIQNQAYARQYADHIDSKKLETQAMAVDDNKNRARTRTSQISGTVNGYHSIASTDSDDKYDSTEHTVAMRNVDLLWFFSSKNADKFETETSAKANNGFDVLQEISLLDGDLGGMEVMAGVGSYEENATDMRFKTAIMEQRIEGINARSFTNNLAALSPSGSKSQSSFKASDVLLGEMHSHGTISAWSPYTIPHADTSILGSFISGSRIEIESYSQDHLSNATYTSMRLKSNKTANAWIEWYDQVAMTADQGHEYYPITYSWIRSPASASGDATFEAWASNKTAMQRIRERRMLNEESLSGFGRVKDGNPGIHFSVPDSGVEPYYTFP